jgi:hypothetical protein
MILNHISQRDWAISFYGGLGLIVLWIAYCVWDASEYFRIKYGPNWRDIDWNEVQAQRQATRTQLQYQQPAAYEAGLNDVTRSGVSRSPSTPDPKDSTR